MEPDNPLVVEETVFVGQRCPWVRLFLDINGTG